MAPLITVILAIATTCFAFGMAIHRGDLFKGAPAWVELSLFITSAFLYILAAILAIIHWRKDSKKIAEPSATAERNRTITQEASPHMEQHVHVGDEVLRRYPPPLLPREPKPHPELELIGCKATMIGYGSMWFEINPVSLEPNQWKTNAFVAIFRNKPAPPGKQATPAHYATAHLIYRNEEGEQQIVKYGTWLGKYEHSADFKSGESQALVLSSTVRAGHQKDKGTYVFDNQHKFNIFNSPHSASAKVIRAPEEKLLLPQCSELEVSIVSENVTLYQGTFRRVGDTAWSPM